MPLKITEEVRLSKSKWNLNMCASGRRDVFCFCFLKSSSSGCVSFQRAYFETDSQVHIYVNICIYYIIYILCTS